MAGNKAHSFPKKSEQPNLLGRTLWGRILARRLASPKTRAQLRIKIIALGVLFIAAVAALIAANRWANSLQQNREVDHTIEIN